MDSGWNHWIACRTRKPDARLRLFCLPYAGGGALTYRTWGGEMPADVEICPIQLPGREERISERRFRRMSELASVVANVLTSLLDKPFALFGHSMGALAAFEIARELRRRGLPQPVHLFLSGHSAPRLGAIDRLHDLPDADLVAELLRLNSSRKEALKNRELMDLMLPLVRADLEVCETYVYSAGEPLNIPITIFGGAEDHRAGPQRLRPWRAETNAAFNEHFFAGGHFFLESARPAFLEALRAELRAVMDRPAKRTHG